jgi:hypothetical protein
MQKYQDRVFSTAGQPIQGVLVTVYNQGTSTLAAIYSDDGVTLTGNPVSTDVNGYFAFYAADGRYDIGFSGSAIASPLLLTDVELRDATRTVGIHNNGTFTNTQHNPVLQVVVNNEDYSADYATEQSGNHATDAVLGAILIPNTSTVHGANAVAGYINNLDASTDGVAIYGQARSTANNAPVWGSNVLVSDVVGLTGGRLLGQELDINIRGTPAFVQGLQITGQCTGVMPAGSQAIGIAPLGSTPWPNGIQIGDGSAVNAIVIGATVGTANHPSQTLIFVGRDAGNVQRNATLGASQDGDVALTPAAGRSTTSPTFTATATTGTAPLVVSSTTPVPNLTVARLATVTSYNGVATAANGVPAIYGTSDQTAQGGNIGATTLFTPAASGLLYRVTGLAMVTRAGTTSTLPSIVLAWTDADNNTAQTFALTPTNAGNALTTSQQGSVIINPKGTIAVSYTTTGFASTGGTSMQYAVHLRIEAI